MTPSSPARATARACGTEAVVFDNVARDMMLDPSWRVVADSMIRKIDAQLRLKLREASRGLRLWAKVAKADAAPG